MLKKFWPDFPVAALLKLSPLFCPSLLVWFPSWNRHVKRSRCYFLLISATHKQTRNQPTAENFKNRCFLYSRWLYSNFKPHLVPDHILIIEFRRKIWAFRGAIIITLYSTRTSKIIFKTFWHPQVVEEGSRNCFNVNNLLEL